ncbi:MAG: hypothetical protein HY908_26360 [Myxococcales bacterium]|nr:hypothetical protein [Myxococcales bacterium]
MTPRRAPGSHVALVALLLMGAACGPASSGPAQGPEVAVPAASALVLEPLPETEVARPGGIAPGSLDGSFGKQGVVVGFPGTSGESHLAAVAVDADGRIVAAGYVGPPGEPARMMALRMLPDGRPDASFGARGLAVVPTEGSSFAQGVALGRDGEVWVSGYRGEDAMLVRFRPDGTLDARFGQGGVVETDYGSRDDRGGQVVALADGGALTVGIRCEPCGGHRLAPTHYGIVVVRHGADGRPLGKQQLDVGTQRDFPTRIARAPDGGLVIGGYTSSRQPAPGTSYDLFAARLGPDLALDTGFGEGGYRVVDLGGDEIGWALAVAPDGKILLGGHSELGHVASPAVVRLTPGGALDESFGGGRGSVVLRRREGELQLYGLHALADGAIVGTGFARAGGDAQATLALVRFTAAGAADVRAWPPDGTRVFRAGKGESLLGTSALAPDGRIVLAGYLSSADEGGAAEVVVARVWP